MSADRKYPGSTVSGVVAIIRLREGEPDDAIAAVKAFPVSALGGAA
ncbi:hypothetical protein [Nonomuraea phyllanthi]|nr:hypothetical protein [Nonomuraea phyllanthi]